MAVEILYKDVGRHLELARKNNLSISLCHGCFDVLHKGHLELFKKAKEVSQVLVVGIAADEYITETKGSHKPKFSKEERVVQILSTGLVDIVFERPYVRGSNLADFYEFIRPNFVITATDEFVEKRRGAASVNSIEIIVMDKIDSSRNYY